MVFRKYFNNRAFRKRKRKSEDRERGQGPARLAFAHNSRWVSKFREGSSSPSISFVSASTILSGSVDLSLAHSSRRGESFFPKCLKEKNFEQTAKRGKERRLAIVWGTEGGRPRRHQPCTGRPAGGRAGEPQLTGRAPGKLAGANTGAGGSRAAEPQAQPGLGGARPGPGGPSLCPGGGPGAGPPPELGSPSGGP